MGTVFDALVKTCCKTILNGWLLRSSMLLPNLLGLLLWFRMFQTAIAADAKKAFFSSKGEKCNLLPAALQHEWTADDSIFKEIQRCKSVICTHSKSISTGNDTILQILKPIVANKWNKICSSIICSNQKGLSKKYQEFKLIFKETSMILHEFALNEKSKRQTDNRQGKWKFWA